MSSLEKLPASRFLGSSAVFFRAEPGVVVKAPVTVSKGQTIRERPSVAKNYLVERQIFDRLGQHPRIVRCFGWLTEFPTGLLLAEASHGSLQCFLDRHNEAIPLSLRKRWVRQAIESIAYIHGRGVIHSDLRPDDFLAHGQDLWLCDFGKSTCRELGICGGGVPDAGFFDPNSPWVSTPGTDIFSLGSVLYTILKGHWPYRTQGGSFETLGDMDKYAAHVEDLFGQGIFPEVNDLVGGEIILGCWTKKYATAQDIPEEAALSECCSLSLSQLVALQKASDYQLANVVGTDMSRKEQID
ncbi:hypothetical protein O1611_g6335 [Lasiodiplodia mahajangana]|uniref:Uncharacterized protein n=1 Tax=Lasiodiplodia mahajangana TaxID=1108764 RepID=A0ACC2JJ44_9PEZI|nr:hypothetical protein O1611_g6335 [Lasiodiplodia mahajangana]